VSRAAALLPALLLAAACLSCADEPAPSPDRAPVTPRAAWLLEPPRVGVGQTVTLELAVVTPPGFTVAPYAPGPTPPGLELLAHERADVEQGSSRWIHRTRLRLRATATGDRTWPSGVVVLDAPDGDSRELALPEHPIEVVSILPEYPDRTRPFGVRLPAGSGGGDRPVWLPALLGAATALATVALVALARRRRRLDRDEERQVAVSAGPSPSERARSELAALRARADEDPFAAAHALSITLRRFVDRRFGTHTTGRSGEELREQGAPFAVRSRWPALLAILAGLDELRFRPATEAAARDALSGRLATLVEQAECFVADAAPPEGPR